MANSLKVFCKKWTLPLSMLAGVVGYFLYTSIPLFDGTHALANQIISIVQPILIFTMLLLTFLKIRPSQLIFCRWHLWGLILQLGLFSLCAFIITILPNDNWSVIIEGGMLCLICPTATAAAVVTGKLGGNQAQLTSYTILINLCVALAVPAVIPLIHPNSEVSFITDAVLIMRKIFPLLFCPFLLAIIMRRFTPRLCDRFTSIPDMAFYLWVIALALAIAVTVRSIVHTPCPWQYQLGIALSSALACILQFAVGRWIGSLYGEKITVAQSLGQKNTVFAIWMGYTFMTPVTSIAGGFYSVWHNIYNAYQLAKKQEYDTNHK